MEKVLPVPHEEEKWKSQNLSGNDKPKPKPNLPPATALLVCHGSNHSVSTLSKQFVLILVVSGGYMTCRCRMESHVSLTHTQIKKIWHLV